MIYFTPSQMDVMAEQILLWDRAALDAANGRTRGTMASKDAPEALRLALNAIYGQTGYLVLGDWPRDVASPEWPEALTAMGVKAWANTPMEMLRV